MDTVNILIMTSLGEETKLPQKNVVHNVYADDLVVMVTGRHGKIISDLIKTALNMIQSWYARE